MNKLLAILSITATSLPIIPAFVITPPHSSSSTTSIIPSPTQLHSTTTSSRRTFLLTTSTLLTTTTILLPPQPSHADVSSGDLPPGAASFSRILKTRSDITSVKRRLASSFKGESDDISREEWDNLGDFLRKIYSAAGDMKGMGIADAGKKKRAVEVVSLLEKVSQAGEVPVNKKDKEALLVVLDKAQGLMDEFFDLLSDVPDEI